MSTETELHDEQAELKACPQDRVVMRGKHTIVLDDLAEAMKTELVLASSCDARCRTAKDLKFRAWDQTYLVRYFDGKDEHKESFSSVTDAIGKYNSYDA